MFGTIVSGRPVQFSPTILSPTQYTFTLSPSPPFSHIVVFLLPGNIIPIDTAAAVYIQIPPRPEFRFLGAIGVGKESAIFKVSGLAADGAATDGSGDADAMVDESSPAPTPGAVPTAGDITLGISIEPAVDVAVKLEALKQQSAGASSAVVLHQPGSGAQGSTLPTKVLAQRIIQNAFNFLASFSSGQGTEVVPLKSFEEWWRRFESRVERNPGFLEREQG